MENESSFFSVEVLDKSQVARKLRRTLNDDSRYQIHNHTKDGVGTGFLLAVEDVKKKCLREDSEKQATKLFKYLSRESVPRDMSKSNLVTDSIRFAAYK